MTDSLDKQAENKGKPHRWQPGESGNPNGRPKKEACLTSLLKEELDRIPTIEQDGFDGKGKTNAWWIIRKAVIEARSGDKAAREIAWERAEGKVTIQIGGDEDKPIYVLSVPSEQGRKDVKRVMEGERT